MKRSAVFGIMLLIGIADVSGQVAQLDRYIKAGLHYNSTIRQEQADYRSAKEALLEARSRFLPELWLKSRYTRADGGRSVTIPVGEMVQESFRDTPLGAMLSTSSPPDPVTITIMPETEQETKLQLIQPLFAPALVANHRLQSQLLSVREMALQAATLTLVRDIRLAYFSCLQAQEVLTLYDAAAQRSARHLETARKLFDAGSANATAVLAAKAAHAQSMTVCERGRNEYLIACRAFNLLLGYPLDTTLQLEQPDSSDFLTILDGNKLSDGNASGSTEAVRRPEILQLEAAEAASRSYLSVEKSGFAPTLAAALEGGIIGDRYALSERTLFYTASVLLEWELFSGLGRMRKVRMAHAALDKIIEQKKDVERQIRLQIEKCSADLSLARRVCSDSELQVAAAEKHHEAVFKQFEQGRANATDLTEAGELLTKAQTARTVARYDLFKQQAHLRYATATDTVWLAEIHQSTGSTR